MIASAALRAAIEHAAGARFEHLGSTLAEVPGVRERLARAYVRHAQARAYLHAVAAQVAEGDPDAQLGVLGVKAATAEMAIEVTDLCLRIGGGAAYSKHGPLERHLRDARAASVMAPTTDVLHDFLGKALTGQELFWMAEPYRVGAVVYHPRVEQIWSEFGEWFADQGFPIAVRYHERYEDQVDDLLSGALDTAWNTNLAHVQTLAAGGAARASAMRDTDRGWRSLIVAREDSGLRSLEDLRGKRLGFGDADSPQAQILPVHLLRAAGFDPGRDCLATRLDRDLGKHGDTGGAELAQLARVRAGELDACVVSSVMFGAIERMGDASGLVTVWTSPPFHHCCFTVLTDDERHARFAELLFAMDPADPRLCEPMELEYVNRWVPFEPSGYRDLIDAVRAGPIVVGATEIAR